MIPGSKVYIAGHQGLVGSALVRQLSQSSYTLLLKARSELDLRNQHAVREFFFSERPDYVFLAAGYVGGIAVNDAQPVDFLYDNLMIAANVMYAAHAVGVKKLLFLGSSCVYPRNCAQPIKEESLLSGSLEKTNEAYAVAKIAGLKLVQAYRRQYNAPFISCMPTNLYGPGDTFDAYRSHVIPALIHLLSTARDEQKKTVSLWGTGMALREFLFVEDCAEALIFLMKFYDEDLWINVGSGFEISIKELAALIKQIVGFQGLIEFDAKNHDGAPRKRLDCSRLESLGWRAKTPLLKGLQQTVSWYQHLFMQKTQVVQRQGEL